MDGWILVSAPDESSSVNQCWNGKEWIDIEHINNASLSMCSSGSTIEQMRSFKARLQSNHTDRDVRLAEISIAVTLDRLLN